MAHTVTFRDNSDIVEGEGRLIDVRRFDYFFTLSLGEQVRLKEFHGTITSITHCFNERADRHLTVCGLN